MVTMLRAVSKSSLHPGTSSSLPLKMPSAKMVKYRTVETKVKWVSTVAEFFAVMAKFFVSGTVAILCPVIPKKSSPNELLEDLFMFQQSNC